ncbi:uncharacterized protein GLRG_06045 [Colletotrichum graminicola M1.001]|uniref:Uncharacterized protein n=1 Tax=Colletotrichum graminicola (strain M1.001 / M2 / FGSC 10212) TaxID=645133 RepID=E3QJ63_COLGM|nr:uncharacterized protein GLRG_06045 [Colletotrichum graminicola M1.001]EFQ30901.1 hypothetical protein GLRG_06045 [Colletotrichum graminicola M1.001]
MILGGGRRGRAGEWEISGQDNDIALRALLYIHTYIYRTGVSTEFCLLTNTTHKHTHTHTHIT